MYRSSNTLLVERALLIYFDFSLIFGWKKHCDSKNIIFVSIISFAFSKYSRLMALLAKSTGGLNSGNLSICYSKVSLCGDFLDWDDLLRFELFLRKVGDSRVCISSATIKLDSSSVILCLLELSFFLSSSLRELFFLRELLLSFLLD